MKLHHVRCVASLLGQRLWVAQLFVRHAIVDVVATVENLYLFLSIQLMVDGLISC